MKGFFTLPIMGWVAVAAGVAFLGLSIALKVQSSRLETCKTEAAAFQASVKANGELAQKLAKAKEAQDAKQIQGALSERDAALKRLRLNSASRRVSDNSAGPGAGATVCVPTTTYNSAMGEFGKELARRMADARRLVEEGDAAQIDAVSLIKAWPLKMDTLH